MKRIEKLLDMGEAGAIEAKEKFNTIITNNAFVHLSAWLGWFMKWLNEDIPDPIKLTPEQEKAVRELLDLGVETIERPSINDFTCISSNNCRALFDLQDNPGLRCLKDADWLTDEPVELRGLLDG